jgi:hypothetical protein
MSSTTQTDPLNIRAIEGDIRNAFLLPIYLAEGLRTLDEDIVTDLELVKTVDDNGVSVLSRTFDTHSTDKSPDENDTSTCAKELTLGEVMYHDMAKYYTNNKSFIKDTQSILQKWKRVEPKETPIVRDAVTLWNELRNDKGFKEKYIYLDWESLLFLNTNQTALQALSMYNLIAPVLALIVPCIICIVPFFIMISSGNSITFATYIEALKSIAGNHAITKIFTGFSGMTVQQTLYSLVSIGFYLLSLYQNTQICMKFYTNMFKIHDKLFQICEFVKYVELEMDAFLESSSLLPSYEKFNETVRSRREVLVNIRDTITNIEPCEISYSKLMDMGKVLKWFYIMHTDDKIQDAMLFSFGFIGYITNMQGVQKNILTLKMNYGSLLEEGMERENIPTEQISSKKKKKKKHDKKNTHVLDVGGVYHPATDTTCDTPVKNDVILKKDCVITGPNASGKTTILKSLFLSILFTQQYGCGFYDTCSFVPYSHLHCYLNIPDTSGRDSLFQSESRKCKDILDSIQQDGSTSRHFCLFDELYSGTNPLEAVKCGYAYLCHLSETENIDYVLTTHYNELCEKLKKTTGLTTYRMKVNVPKESVGSVEQPAFAGSVEQPAFAGSFEYLYKIEEGINDVDGGVEVLRQMKYPTDILNKLSKNV